MSEQRRTDAGIETINTTRHQANGVQCTHLNYNMNTEFPLYAPYEDFRYDAAMTLMLMTHRNLMTHTVSLMALPHFLV